ncbi:MAG TPA: flagellar biosynthesis protein FlhA [Phycisphaerae bacterium]|nr:flagellar biosynthesis protein FlhA [Phycisphaerae bacterium]
MAPENDNLAASADPPQTGIWRLLAHNDIVFAAGLTGVLATLLLPLPTFVMDLLLSTSIAVALSTLVITLSARESIEFSTFPSLLLFLTLFRLSLNVASTRLILLQGDAGRIIEFFGQMVVGGQLIVGMVVFLILVVIQFVVITKGAERISEVAARFNLDAMPGKQMAIDADLNAGLVGEDEARQRRQKIVRESEFYGSMDGASKFIRGDAIAGLVITGINLVGGFVMGTTRGLTAAESIRTYAILAVGDGLVSQIPALIISTSAGFLVSKTSSKGSISQDLVRQLFAKSRPLWIASFILAAMVFVPNLPKMPFVALSLMVGIIARSLGRSEREQKAGGKARKAADSAEPAVEELLDVDRVAILVGARLIKTVDPRRKSSLSHRIGPLRRKFAERWGLILPLVRLKDNVALDANTYEIRLNNHVVGTGRLEPDMFMAMDPGTVEHPVAGKQAVEPVFHLPALWIGSEKKEEAELRGYTVVDPESVLITHLSETLRQHAHEVLSRDDVQRLVDRLREKQPTLVNSVVGDVVPLALLHRVLQGLLRDGIPIRDLPKVLETLGDHATRTKDAAVLTEMTRKGLVRTITEQHADFAGRIKALTLEPSLEYELRGALAQPADGDGAGLPPERSMEVIRRVADVWKEALAQGHDGAAVLCDALLRPHLAGLLARQVPQLPVLAYDEIAPGTDVESVGTVSLEARADKAALVPAR